MKAPSPSSNSNEKEISRDEMLQSFLTDEALNDVTLKGSDGVEVPANRFLLSARSPVFRGLLLGKFKEASSPAAIELGFQGSVVNAVVEYIYTDSAEMVESSTSEEDGPWCLDFEHIRSLVTLVEAATYFQLPKLAKKVIHKFDQIWETNPCSSFAILQACNMAGPSIPTDLVEEAMYNVRCAPEEAIAKEHIDCLGADVLEQILKDTKMRMTEFQLFRVLEAWSKGDEERHVTATNHLSKHIGLERIDPQTLSTTITESGLFTSEQLFEAYKHQALEANKASPSENQLRNPWVKVADPNRENPMEIKVEGAGSAEVNGVYIMDGTHDGIAKYSKRRANNNNNNGVVWIFVADSLWYISRPDGNNPGTDNDEDFYNNSNFDGDGRATDDIPPSEGWSTTGSGVAPAPKLMYMY